jgi:ubiquinone/menaquinone biosynthesis C-methylase UbiE
VGTDRGGPAAERRRVRDFYEGEGWRWSGGRSGDARRWGTSPHGALGAELRRRRLERLRALAGLDRDDGRPGPAVAEIGCGGQPALDVLAGARSYVGCDFSRRGLRAAASAAAAATHAPSGFVEAEASRLPLRDGAFDVVFSAHMLYHLANAEAQGDALREMARVVAPGGVVAVVTATPYPLLFPGRCLRRLVARTPALRDLAARVRPSAPLTYVPMPPAWIADVLSAYGSAVVHPHAVPTTGFARRVSEERAVGRALWQAVGALERHLPRAAARLGAYALVVLNKD